MPRVLESLLCLRVLSDATFSLEGSGIVTRRPLVLQLYKSDDGSREYAEFLLMPSKGITDFAAVRKEISNERDRIVGRTKQISVVPIHLSVYSPNVVNLTRIDLFGLTKIADNGQSDDIMADIENMVRSYTVLRSQIRSFLLYLQRTKISLRRMLSRLPEEPIQMVTSLHLIAPEQGYRHLIESSLQ